MTHTWFNLRVKYYVCIPQFNPDGITTTVLEMVQRLGPRVSKFTEQLLKPWDPVELRTDIPNL